MSGAIIVDVGDVHNAGATLTQATFTAPSTNVVRNGTLTNPVYLAQVWRNGVTKGESRITSPKIVPVSRGIEFLAPAGNSGWLMQGLPMQVLTPQDVLTVSMTGGTTEDDQTALCSYYTDLPGVNMTLKSPGDIIGQSAFTFAWPVAAAASATIGGQGNTVITTTVDSSTANAWYAVLGYVTDALVTAVGITGVDTSQSFVGGPGIIDAFKTNSYFIDLSVATGLPCIPCFNAANKGSTNVTVVDVAVSTAVNVNLVLAEMPLTWAP